MANICIISLTNLKFDENSLINGCGGSETWVIKISETFANLGHNISIIANCDTHKQNEHITWHSFNDIEIVLSNNVFDAIICSRVFTQNLSNLLKNNDCDNIYLMAHDTYIINENNEPIYYDNLNEWEQFHIKKCFVLSEIHKRLFVEQWKFPKNKIDISANGLDFNLLENYSNNTDRDNSILWSIRYERHFDVLVDKLFPIIKKYVPDFKIYTCSYQVELPQKYKNCDYIIDLGQLSKDELYKEMSKHKIYFHPMLFFETFCISILESIMSGCNIITAYNYGAATTLMPYKGFLLSNDIDYNNIKDCNYVAMKIINGIFEYNSEENKALRESMQIYLKNMYSWEKIANDLLKYMKII